MKKKSVASIFTFAVVALTTGIIFSSIGDSNVKAAEALAYKACDGSLVKLSFQDRANLAAQAYHLDVKWLRLSDALNAQAGYSALKRGVSRWVEATGNDIGALNLSADISYAQYVAECSVLP